MKFLIYESTLSKDEYLLSKLNNKKYNDFGNFSKHIIENGFTVESYWLTFYSQYLPKCLESNEICANHTKTHWNKWYKLKHVYMKELSRLTNNTNNKLKKLKSNGYNSKYLTFDYWIIDNKKKLSEALEILRYLTCQKYGNYYERLVDSWYDENWDEENKLKYITSILNRNPIKLISILSINGLLQRKNISIEEATSIHNRMMISFPSAWKLPDIQKKNSKLLLNKSPTNSPFSFKSWCILYTYF